LIISIKDGVVKIIGGDFVNSNSKVSEKFQEIWHKVQAAFKALGDKIAASLRKVAEKFAGLGKKIDEHTRALREKIAAMAKKISEKVVGDLEGIVGKYKDIIIEALTKDSKVIIDEGRKFVIKLVKDAVQIVVDGIHMLHGGGPHAENSVITDHNLHKAVGGDALNLVVDMGMDTVKIVMKEFFAKPQDDENSIASIWESVKEKIFEVKGSISASTEKVLSKYKPEILDAVKHLKSVVIACGKDLIISIKDGVVKVLSGEIVESNSKVSEKIQQIWTQIEDAFKRLGAKIVASAKALGEKLAGVGSKIDKDTAKLRAKILALAEKYGKDIIATFTKLSEKYRQVITEGLTTVGKVVIDEGRSIAITVVKGVVKVVIDGIHMLGGKHTFSSEDVAVEENDVKEIWEKVKVAIVGELHHVQVELKSLVTKYVPQLLAELKKLEGIFKKDGKTLMIDLLSQLIKIILGWGYEDSNEMQEYSSVKEILAKIQAAVAAEMTRFGSEMTVLVKKYAPKFLEQWNKVKHVVLVDGKNMLIDLLTQLIKIILGWGYEDTNSVNGKFQDVLEKVKAAVVAEVKRFKVQLKALVTKYIPQAIEQWKKIKDVVIKQGKDMAIDLLSQLMKIILGWGYQAENQVNGLTGIWERILATAQKLESTVRVTAIKIIEQYKPKIIEAVTTLKHLVVACGKDLIIQIKDGIIKIIADGSSATSDGSSPAEFMFEGDYVMVSFKDAELVAASNGLKETWAKVQEAFKQLGEKIKAKSEELWKKIGPAAEAIIKKYKDVIVDAIIKDGKVIISEGRRIAITVIKDVVQVIIDGIHSITKPQTNGEDNGFRETWSKVKKAFKDFGGKVTGKSVEIWKKIGPQTEKIIGKYKEKIIEALKRHGRIVINEGREIVISVINDVVRVVVDGIDILTHTKPTANDENGFRETWAKVQQALKELGEKVKSKSEAIWKKIGPAAEKALGKYKDVILEALKKDGQVIITEGRKIVITVINDVVKVVIDGIDALTGEKTVPMMDDEAQLSEQNGMLVDWVIGHYKAILEGFLKTIKAFAGRYKEDLKGLLAKYTPRMMAGFKQVFRVVWGEVQELMVDVAGDVIKWILKHGQSDFGSKVIKVIQWVIRHLMPQAQSDEGVVVVAVGNSLGGIWDKVLATAGKLSDTVRDSAKATLEKYKPKIIEAVTKLQKVVIACGKDLIVQIKDGIVKIIADGSTATSDDSSPSEFFFKGHYVMLSFKDAELSVNNGFKEIWAKVQEAFKEFGEKVKAKSEAIWKKLGPAAMKVLGKYKDVIIDALEKDGKVIIVEGRKIVITIINDVVKVVIDAIDALTGEKTVPTAGGKGELATENGIFKDMWNKVYDQIIAKLGGVIGKASIDAIKKHKKAFMEALKKLKSVILEGGHKLSVRISKHLHETIVEIFSDGKKVSEVVEKTEAYAMLDNGIVQKVWDMIYDRIIGKLGGVVGKATIDTIKKHKEAFMKALQHLGEVMVEGGHKMQVKIIKDVKETIIEIFVDGKKVEEVVTEPDFALEENKSFGDLWGKIIDTVQQLGEAVSGTTAKVVEEFKPQILHALQDLKKVVVKGVKTVIIEVKDAVIKVLSGGVSATSDGSSFVSDEKIYAVVEGDTFAVVVE